MLYPLFGSPRLPKIEKSQPHKIDLSGTVVRFAVPPFSAKWGESPKYSSHLNLYDTNEYVHADEDFPFIECYKTRWDILGFPFFQSIRGWIRFSVSILKMPENQNNFRILDFEKNLQHFYETQYGPNSGKKNSFEALLDWHEEKINSQAWVFYRILENPKGTQGHTLMWEQPISSTHNLAFAFYYQNYNNNINLDESIISFANEVMSHTHIDFSPSAKELKTEAEKENPGQRYSEHMEPLRWIRPKKEFISVEEFLKDDDK